MNFRVSGFLLLSQYLFLKSYSCQNYSHYQPFYTNSKKYKIVIPIILKGTLSISVRDHMLDCNHSIAWIDFKVLGRQSKAEESLFKRSTFNL